ncbi:hypothetical protein PENTCL1PPCAC_29698, partial [Pristionchus entomophagus]
SKTFPSLARGPLKGTDSAGRGSVSRRVHHSSSPPLPQLKPRLLATIRMLAYSVFFFPLLVASALAQDATTAAAAIEATATTVEGSGAAATADVSSTTATTTAAAAGNGTKCEAWSVCSSADDCGTGGTCLGAFVGKCNCNACINFWLCKEDAACGGLKGACDLKSGTCRCWETLEKAGFPFIKAATELCNAKACTADSADCLGLPCNTGRCVCKVQPVTTTPKPLKP